MPHIKGKHLVHSETNAPAVMKQNRITQLVIILKGDLECDVQYCACDVATAIFKSMLIGLFVLISLFEKVASTVYPLF